MDLGEIFELISSEIKQKSYIDISEFLKDNNIKNLKVKDLVEEIETKYNTELILDSKNSEIYSYDLVYNYLKLKLFKLIETGNDIDLTSDFKEFKPDDLIKIFSIIDSEFFSYLLENI
jgi:hypothetical protein